MKVYFGGDDYDGHVIEEEVRIDGESKDGTIDNKVTEELPLWVFAFPSPDQNNVRRPHCRAGLHKARRRRRTLDCGQSGKGQIVAEPDYSGLVTYSFKVPNRPVLCHTVT